jgi:hypothetical protein
MPQFHALRASDEVRALTYYDYHGPSKLCFSPAPAHRYGRNRRHQINVEMITGEKNCRKSVEIAGAAPSGLPSGNP